MSQRQKLTVTLSGGQLDALNQAVTAGDYTDTDAIITEALDDWQSKRNANTLDATELRKLWDEGLASGPPTSLDVADVLATARQRFSESNSK